MRLETEVPVLYQTNSKLPEYLLVAHPDEEVNKKILEEKRSFDENYEQEAAGRTMTHIPIAGFFAKEMMEATLVRWIQNICTLQTAFAVVLNNFSGFPPHTIYLRVLDPKPFGQLASAVRILDGFVQANDCPPLHVIPKPYVTIAAGLPAAVYNDAIQQYACRLFHESFRVDKLFLLRKGGNGKCHLVNSFILPQP